MATNNIASGAVVLTANADPLTAALVKAQADVDAWAGKTQSKINTGLNAKPATKTPAMSKDLAKGLKAGELSELGLTGATVALGMAVAKSFASHHVELFNHNLERSRELAEGLGKAFAKHEKGFLDRWGTGPGTREKIDERITSGENAKQGIERTLRESREKLDALKNSTGRSIARGLTGWLPGVDESFAVEETQLTEEIKGAQSRLASQVEALEALRARLAEPMSAAEFAELGGDSPVDRDAFAKAQEAAKQLDDDGLSLVESLKLQAWGFGKAGAEAEVFALRFKGASGDVIDEAENLAVELKKLNANQGADELTEKLRLQAHTFGMTGDQAEIYGLKVKGASALAIQEAELVAAHMQSLENIMKDNGPKLAGAIEAGSADAFKVQLRSQGFDVGDVDKVHKDNGKKLDKIAELNKDMEKRLAEIAQERFDTYE